MAQRVTKQSRTLNRKLLLVVLVLLVVFGGGAFAYYHHTNHKTENNDKSRVVRPVNSVSNTPSTAQDNAENDARKGSNNPAETLDNGSSATSNSTLSAQIVSASAANGNIHIGTLVNGATSGTCTITATQDHTTTTLTTIDVSQDVNSYDCGGGAINVPTSKLSPASGTWQLKLTVTSGSTQATDTASINL